MNFSEDEVNKTVEVLKKGGIILYPTDTVWGIGCDATNDVSIEKIFQLKNRAKNKSMIVLLDSENKLQRYVKEVPEQAWNLIEFSEKPLTIIYDDALNISQLIIADDGSIGIRITKDEFCKKVIYKLGRPIVSTSANISGMDAPLHYSEIDQAVLNGVDYIVNLRHREKALFHPSTIIKLNKKGHIKIIRK